MMESLSPALKMIVTLRLVLIFLNVLDKLLKSVLSEPYL